MVRCKVDGFVYWDDMKGVLQTEKEMRAQALEVLSTVREAEAVIYCVKDYNEDGEVTEAQFYLKPLTVDEVIRSTSMLPSTAYVGVLYRH